MIGGVRGSRKPLQHKTHNRKTKHTFSMLGKNDPRLSILVNWIQCAIPEQYRKNERWCEHTAIETFIEDGNCRVLEVCIVSNNGNEVCRRYAPPQYFTMD